MKKLMLLAALLAMLVVAAIPAIAQVGQENEQEGESGDVEQAFEVVGGGDNSSQCAGIQGVSNTGNAQSDIAILQYASEAEDFEFEEVGGNVTVSPESSTACDQQVNQAASAAS